MRESILARLARFTVRSCLKPALQPTFPVPVPGIIKEGNRASEVVGRIRALIKKVPRERTP